jgi:acyl-coenzyme A synthetase/AMP-(fatty) acid ligase
MSTLPLIAHSCVDATVAWRGGKSVSARQFLHEVEYLVAQLPAGRHVLNLCSDRYRFTVALAACIVSGRVSVLPPNHTVEMVRQMQRLAPDVFCIADQDACGADLPVFRYPDSMPPQAVDALRIPQINCDQLIARVFTSGSTGEPTPHGKRWGSLVCNVLAEGARLGITPAHVLVGTVPAQHMYGLETTVLLPLQCGAALHDGSLFYPDDICTTLEQLPRPRVLVTSPYHLRALLAASTKLPAADLLLSATAPLSTHLAAEAERRFGCPLLEIYGCTETGQIATRRTTAGAAWQTFPGVRLRSEDEAVWAEGGHIETPTRLNDVIELIDASPGHFLLHGRHADLVNIAGKRTSLAYLNYQLNAIPGVQDGVFVLPADDAGALESVRRLVALVVAPTLTPAALMHALRERIDPIFLPRPLLFVDALPRNATGKLPTQLAQALLVSLQTKSAHGLPA